MAEGDTILRLARRLSDALASSPVTVSTPGPRRPSGIPAASLDGRTLESVETRGKHLLLHFSGSLALHSHLGMRGSWDVHPAGEAWRRPRRSAWIALASERAEAVNFGGSSLRIVREVELWRDPRLARLGPDLLAEDVDAGEIAARLEADRDRELGDALLDQSLVAGIGNIFKSEACFAAGVSPWRRTGELSRERVASTLEAARNLMLEAVRTGRRADGVYGRAGRPCPRCGTRILSRAQGDAARITYWCPKCQPEAG